MQRDPWGGPVERGVAAALESLGLAAPGAAAARQWKANLARSCPQGAQAEWSSILSPEAKTFHDTRLFVPILPVEKPTPWAPEISLAGDNFAVKSVTLPDRIASVARLGLTVMSNQVLHNATLTAETYGPSGKRETTARLATIDRIYYNWSSPQPFEVTFAQDHAQGGVRILLKAEEGTCEQWFRFGGWEGTPQAGSIYGPGLVGQALCAPCFLPDAINIDNERSVKLFNPDEGTIEFWVCPQWDGVWMPPQSTREIRLPRNVFLHYGPVDREHPASLQKSPLWLAHDHAWGSLMFTVAASPRANGVAGNPRGAYVRIGRGRQANGSIWPACGMPARPPDNRCVFTSTARRSPV